jgi:hypothetical protein
MIRKIWLKNLTCIVKMSNKFRRVRFSGPGVPPYTIGGAKIGGSYIPANTTVRITYVNSNNVAKTFRGGVEYLY